MSIKYTEIVKIEHVDGFDPKTGQKMVRDISFCRIRYWSAKKLLYIYWIRASTLMLGMDLLENSNYIRVSLQKTQL